MAVKRRRIDTRRGRQRNLARRTIRDLLATTSSIRAAQNPVGKVEYVSSTPSVNNKQLIFRFETRAMTPGKRKYPETIIFHKVDYSETPDDQHPVQIALASGAHIYASRLSAAQNPVSVRCSCFPGDTRVWVPGRGAVPLDVLSQRTEPFPVLSCTQYGTVVEGRGEQCEVKDHAVHLVRVHLPNDGMIECTPDHRIRTVSGEYVQAQELIPHVHVLSGAVDSLPTALPVLYVEDVHTSLPVYCLTVPIFGNFAIAVDNNDTTVFVKNCPDYYFMWGYADQVNYAHAGPKIKPYVRLTPPPPQGYPYRNPDNVEGLCKHLIACVDFLRRKRIIR